MRPFVFLIVGSILTICLVNGASAQEKPCPVAYEVFAPVAKIEAIRTEVSARGAEARAAITEAGDVGRFTALIPISWDLDGKGDIFGISKGFSGEAIKVSMKFSDTACRLSLTEKMNNQFPDTHIYVDVLADVAQKFDDDARVLGLKPTRYTEKTSSVFRFIIPGGATDSKFVSVIYRSHRGDYGDAVFGTGYSLSEIDKIGNIKF